MKKQLIAAFLYNRDGVKTFLYSHFREYGNYIEQIRKKSTIFNNQMIIDRFTL
jgi:hypothetical protein